MKIVVGVSGASGAPYARRLLDFLAAEGTRLGVEVDLIFSETGLSPSSSPAPPWRA